MDPSNQVVLALAYFSLAFIAYFFSSKSKWVTAMARKLGDREEIIEFQVYLERILGTILLGLIPLLTISFFFDKPLTEFGIKLPKGTCLWLWGGLPIVLMLIFSVVRPSKGVNIDFYPQVRKETWNVRVFLYNGLSWIIYLAGYEFAFRGWLFFICIQAFGLIPAIAINSTIYSLTHIPKGISESIGAFFMGFLFCLITYKTGSIIFPLLLHIILAIGNDLKAISLNPRVHISIKANDSH